MGDIKVAITGACGRMSSTVLRNLLSQDDMRLIGAIEAPGHAGIGSDVGELLGVGTLGVKLSSDLGEVIRDADVVVQFTNPKATIEHSRTCADFGKATVIGTTGFSEEEEGMLKGILRGIAAVWSPNMSIGMNLLFKLVREAASILGIDYDVEIVEMHHRFKKDAPSGSAIRLLKEAASGLGLDPAVVYGRSGMVGERPRAQIGVHAVRGGDVVGDHMVIFAGIGERVELIHKASSRDAFAKGAIKAIRFVASAPPGIYGMEDVLGIS
jgi:4-hydroxy-tetrahydrodipicolinate reductase